MKPRRVLPSDAYTIELAPGSLGLIVLMSGASLAIETT
jgi:hypothetical protein